MLGRPSIELDGTALDWPRRRRAGELLAWLALNPGSHSRAELAPVFWPDVLDESARASLRTALHELRTELGPVAAGHLSVSRERVGLDDGVVVDLAVARRLMAEGRDREAVDMGADLLLGIDGDWVLAAREEHRRDVADALGRLAETATAAGDHADAAQWARRRVALDPLAEEAARGLIRALAAGGDRAAALTAYDGLRERMAREMRVVPSPATRALADELRGGAAVEAPGAAPALPGGRRRLGDRLAEAARRSFVGRASEIRRLRAAVAPAGGGPAVVVLHGPGGVGKTRLLDAVTDDLGPRVRVVSLDCRDVEPTPRGFLAAVARALGAVEGAERPDAVADLLGAAAPRTVLALDTYETFGLLDTWLRRSFLPLLPETVVTMTAGRNAPAAAWMTDPGWQGLVEVVRLDGLEEEDALALLRLRGLDESEAARLNRFARGHPLALELAATGRAAAPAPDALAGPSPETIARLVEAVLEGLDPDTVETVRAASVLRRVDEGLLRALRGDALAPDAFDRLRALPFCEAGPAGLLVHDIVRDAVGRDLTHRDPVRAAGYRRAAAAELAARPATGDLWQATADRLYLVQNPSVRDAFFPPGAMEHVLEPAGPDDMEAVERIARAWDPPEACEWIAAWAARRPGAFSVARTADGAVAGFSAVAEIGEEHADLLDDGVGRAWRAHLEAGPIAEGERVLFIRRFLTAEHGEAMCDVMSATFLDVKRLYMEMRPSLRRVYCVAAQPEAAAHVLRPLGFLGAGPPVRIGDGRFFPSVLDFGPDSVDGWLARLIEEESLAAEPAMTAR